MNIFYIDPNPLRAAMQHVDRHVCKMPIELAQMLSTAHRVIDGERAPSGVYKTAYASHPCSVWIRETSANYAWAYLHFTGLLDEYSYRYGKQHATSRLLALLESAPAGIQIGKMTPPAQAMPDEFKDPDPLVAYRAYYRRGKAHLHKWKNRPSPPWITH